MKLVLAIVQDDDVDFLMDELVENNFRATKLASTGAFLRSGNTTLLIGVEDDRVDDCLSLVEGNCCKRTTTTTMMNTSMPAESYAPMPIDIQIGGATIFVLDVEQFKRI